MCENPPSRETMPRNVHGSGHKKTYKVELSYQPSRYSAQTAIGRSEEWATDESDLDAGSDRPPNNSPGPMM